MVTYIISALLGVIILQWNLVYLVVAIVAVALFTYWIVCKAYPPEGGETGKSLDAAAQDNFEDSLIKNLASPPYHIRKYMLKNMKTRGSPY